MTKLDVLGVILGGGRGSRLWPLTKLRAKPAVPIGGKYRLVDIPLSNCLNSGISHIAVLTQFNSVSLHRHISQTYNFDVFHSGWVQILAAEQTLDSTGWYQGTADAIRKQLFEIQVTGAENVIILAGDHLYRMDYGQMLQHHKETGADMTVAVKPVSASDAPRFGILKLAADDRISDFIEKPKEPEPLKNFVSREDRAQPYLGSMGIYIFKMQVLIELLDSDHDDFGGEMIPAAIASRHVYGYTFHGYWEDIGTIRTFYEANLALTQTEPPFHFHDPVAPIYTRPRFLPGTRIYDVGLDQVTLADGCIIEGAEIQHSVIGIRSVIGEDVILRNSVIMGADYYEEEHARVAQGIPSIGIGRGARIQGAIIDKNARIGSGVVIEPFPEEVAVDKESYSVRDGIVIIPKDAILEQGTVIKPE